MIRAQWSSLAPGACWRWPEVFCCCRCRCSRTTCRPGAQSCRHHRAGGRAGLAYAASAASRPRRLVTGHRRAKTHLNNNARNQGNTVMAHAQLQPVLDRIDAISTTAWNGCSRCCGSSRSRPIRPSPAIAKRPPIILPASIATLGFAATSGRPRVIPAIVAKANGGKGRPHVLFYGHYDVQPVDPLNLWHRPPFEPVVTDHSDAGKDHRRARRGGRQGPTDDFRRGLPRLEICHRLAAVDITIVIEGEEEIGFEETLCRFWRRTRPTSKPISHWFAIPVCGTRTRRRSPPRCADSFTTMSDQGR